MQSFNDFFPQEVKDKIIENDLKIGSVLKFKVDFPNGISKNKFQIIVGHNSGKAVLASVFINTEINPNVFPTQSLKDLHLTLQADTNKYLDYDSYVDCSNITEYNADELKNILIKSPATHVGELNEENLNNVLSAIKGSPLISNKKKKYFNLI